MKANKVAYVLCVAIFLVSCSPNSYEDYRKKGDALVKSIACDLQNIRCKEDLSKEIGTIKKKMKKLCFLMIESSDYAEKHPSSLGKEDKSTLYSDQLQYELLRVCEIEGGKKVLEDVQADMLDKLDAYLRKAKRKKLSKSSYYQN
ncbi:hypothetical protein COB11_08110 [Candidatus Aerophobetes bacterium]|uniref:Lipoprotein n=1 Tax=Aerophobetes bacterium TaxID=2030807 RepID=A0A2A4YA83_UNCAE|nr:MAG: hypothetical protein COB11_08110 [Candidatus Aerophobetes bacterium]